ncbi:MAG TPA: DUF2383 domain-containing protein [Blastocatellia bacterium]|nr:DUF2383 domain-containing protein [Blastocatellia bacterium]
MKVINIEGTIRTLNELIKTCHCSQRSFARAAKYLAAGNIKRFCAEQSRVRAQFRADLLEEVGELEGTENGNQKPAKRISSTWIEFQIMPPTEDALILLACRKVDDGAIQQYKKALAYPLPTPVRSVVEYQYFTIQQAYDQLLKWNQGELLHVAETKS